MGEPVQLKITQYKSQIGLRREGREVLRSLKLGKIGSTTTRPDHPTLRGGLRWIEHIVHIEEV